MGKRFTLKSGDVFKVPVGDEVYYIQYLMDDETLFGSNIIRSFDFRTNINEDIDLNNVVDKEMKFITHTSIKAGIKLGVWEKMGNVPLESDFRSPVFRATNDVYSEVKKSNNWFVWNANEKEAKIGKLTKEYKNLPYGTVYHPMDVVKWIKSGINDFMFPE